MKINRYRVYRAAIAVGLGIAVGVAVVTDTPVIALAAVIAAIAIALVLERTNKEIVRDERIVQINGKAATIAFNIMLAMAAVSALLTALFRNQLPENIVFSGSIMGYFVCIALILQMSFYAYFSRKL